jgi:hypothetical protein
MINRANMNTQRKTFLEYLQRREQKRQQLSETNDTLKRDNLLKHKFVIMENVGNVLQSLKIPYAIIGGHAVTYHGRPRMTDDIDILVLSQDAQTAVTQLNLQQVAPLRTGGYSGVTLDDLQIDIVAPGQPWVKEAIEKREITTYGIMVNAPFLVITKLWDSRGSHDETDVLGVLKKMTNDQLNATRQLVNRYLPNDIEDIESLIAMRTY